MTARLVSRLGDALLCALGWAVMLLGAAATLPADWARAALAWAGLA